jgi:hypothetical protein
VETRLVQVQSQHLPPLLAVPQHQFEHLRFLTQPEGNGGIRYAELEVELVGEMCTVLEDVGGKEGDRAGRS